MPVDVRQFSPGVGLECPSPAYLDANFVISFSFEGHGLFESACELLGELLEARVTVVLTTLAVDEIWWGLFCEWYARDHDGRKPTAKAVRQDPTLLDPYREELDSFTGDFLCWPQARFFGAMSADVPSLVRGALQHLMDEGLRPRDAFHLALAQRAHARAFVTSDPDFDNLALPGYDLTIVKYHRPPESQRHSR